MRLEITKLHLPCLAGAWTLLFVSLAWAEQPAATKRGPVASVTKAEPTTMTLSQEGQRLFLEVNPSPVRLEMYAGDRKLAIIEGKNRTRFDITRYAAEVPNGRLQVVAFDHQGRRYAKMLDISRYQDSAERDAAPAAAQTSSRAQPLRQDPAQSRTESRKEIAEQRTREAAGVSQNISAYLQKIERANSLEELRQAFSEADFSQREIQQLADAVKSSRYLNRLKQIADREVANRQVATQLKKGDVPMSASGSKGTITDTHMRRLEMIRREVETMRNSFRTKTSSLPSGRMAAVSDRAPDSEAVETEVQLPSSGSPTWSIDSVSPSVVRIGGNVTISGSGFGATQGRVVVRFAGSPTRRGEVIDCDRIVSWSDSRIIAAIPKAAATRIGDTRRQARIWVKVAGGEVGPSYEITLLPDFSLLPPEIIRMSHTEVIPDQPFLIQGKNFLSAQQGTVALQFVGKEFPAIIGSWDDDAIEIQVPRIIGLMETPGWLVVRNHAGYEAKAPVTFEPAIAWMEIYGPGDAGELSDVITVSCSPWVGVPGLQVYSGDDLAWLLCLFGQKKENRVRISLQNGWTVASWRTHLWRGSGWQDRTDCGAYHESGPVRGSRRIEATRITWTNAFSKCLFFDFYRIEGPWGVPEMDSYDPAGACILNNTPSQPRTPVDCNR